MAYVLLTVPTCLYHAKKPNKIFDFADRPLWYAYYNMNSPIMLCLVFISHVKLKLRDRITLATGEINRSVSVNCRAQTAFELINSFVDELNYTSVLMLESNRS